MQALLCKICGRQPALEVKLRRQVGMIFLARIFTFRGALCKEHGQELANSFLNKTLVQGWWGIVSFFLNIYTVFVDLAALSKFKKLDPPAGPAATAPPPPVPPPPAPSPG
jgi:hypothetical protein